VYNEHRLRTDGNRLHAGKSIVVCRTSATDGGRREIHTGKSALFHSHTSRYSVVLASSSADRLKAFSLS